MTDDPYFFVRKHDIPIAVFDRVLKGVKERCEAEARRAGVEPGSKEHWKLMRAKTIEPETVERKPNVVFRQHLYEVVVDGRHIGDLRLADGHWQFEPLSWFGPVKGQWSKLREANEAIASTEHVRNFADATRQDKSRRICKRNRVPSRPKPLRYEVGRVFGQRTIVALLEPRGKGTRVRYRCVCGNEQEIQAEALRKSESCGCLKRPKVGDVFGIRTVVRSEPKAIRVRCVCGNEQTVHCRTPLETSYSCGCTKPPEDAAGPQQTRIEQRERRQNVSCYLLDIIRKRAAVRDGRVECTIKLADIEVPAVCPHRGVAFQTGTNGQKTDDSPTVVLKDPTQGYVPGNIRVISWAAAQEIERLALIERKKVRAAKEVAERVAAERKRGRTKRRLLADRTMVWAARVAEERKQWSEELAQPVYDTPFASLACGVRLDRVLASLEVVTIRDLLKYETRHIRELPNSGKATLVELRALMERLGVTWPNPAAAKLLNKKDVDVAGS